ncbi:Cys-tRNA(Pro) deacylase [Myxococcota bacterium]|nr:Cys-tRNA(Pro) deacylase [Myxococcota bacterium]MBU1431128.1 Cys-tRNA(Pro) deacylase [Myxococcota bacterium]MBU1899563.1 Cys-tRNA(Pro) deacylase [Myxococcota bacterium]
MAKQKRDPVTAAVRALRAARVDFEGHSYDYAPKGGTRHSAASLGVDEHQVIKTLIFEDEAQAPFVVLMHGDLEVSVGRLAKQLGHKRVSPCAPEVAQRHSGYLVGGTSPFGLRRAMPIYAERSIEGLARLWINGGKRGFLVSMIPAELIRVLAPTWVEVAKPRGA